LSPFLSVVLTPAVNIFFIKAANRTSAMGLDKQMIVALGYESGAGCIKEMPNRCAQ
jgi:hypothetical protein